jgi:oxygen-dependent protoporphyrinogen oxidase
VGELVEDHFGREVLDYVAEPLLAGVYGGDPAQLSAPSVLPEFVDYERALGSLIAGVQKERRQRGGSIFLSFRSGMGELIEALTSRLQHAAEIRNEAVSEIAHAGQHWRIRTGMGEYTATDVVLAVPAHMAARLVRPFHAALASELGAIPYSSAVVASLLFPRDAVARPLDGFGFLVPRPERRLISAATWVNTKFPSRVAAGLAAIRTFIVDPEASTCTSKSDPELLADIRSDLTRLMGVKAEPRYGAVHRWPASMPQQVVGHGDRRARILEAVQQLEGLHLVSNYLDGVGLPDCVRWARAIAGDISGKLLGS